MLWVWFWSTHCQWRRRGRLCTSESEGLWSPQSHPRQTEIAKTNRIIIHCWVSITESKHQTKCIAVKDSNQRKVSFLIWWTNICNEENHIMRLQRRPAAVLESRHPAAFRCIAAPTSWINGWIPSSAIKFDKGLVTSRPFDSGVGAKMRLIAAGQQLSRTAAGRPAVEELLYVPRLRVWSGRWPPCWAEVHAALLYLRQLKWIKSKVSAFIGLVKVSYPNIRHLSSQQRYIITNQKMIWQ